MVLLIFTGFYWVKLGSTGFHCVLRDSDGFHWLVMGLTWSFLVRFHVVRWLGPVHQVGGRGGLGPLETDVAAPRNSIYRGGRCEKRSANDPIIGRRRLLQRPPFFFVVAVAEAVRLLGSFFFAFLFFLFFLQFFLLDSTELGAARIASDRTDFSRRNGAFFTLLWRCYRFEMVALS